MTRRTPTSAPPTPEMKVRFGENLARCREGAEVSQEELSFRASIHRMPRVDTALRIAGSLGVALDDLVAGLEWKPGYEIVVPGSWEVIGRDGDAAEVTGENSVDHYATAEMPNGSR